MLYKGAMYVLLSLLFFLRGDCEAFTSAQLILLLKHRRSLKKKRKKPTLGRFLAWELSSAFLCYEGSSQSWWIIREPLYNGPSSLPSATIRKCFLLLIYVHSSPMKV